MKLWNWLSGKKTKIGAAFILAGKVARTLGQEDLGEILEQIGIYVAGLGLAHAGVKAAKG